jgi:hypothetical protein
MRVIGLTLAGLLVLRVTHGPVVTDSRRSVGQKWFAFCNVTWGNFSLSRLFWHEILDEVPYYVGRILEDRALAL